MKKDICNWIQSVALAGMIVTFTAAFCLGEKREFSEQENRYLNKFPKFSFQALEDGSYMSSLESWVSDQFPFRDQFMNIKAQTEKTIGKQEINGVYLGKDGYLIESYQTPENTDKAIKSFQFLSDSITVPMTVMLVPTAITIYEDKLPAYAQKGFQKDTIEEIYQALDCNTVDVASALVEEKGGSETLYYRMDHHWTTYGAYIGYRSYCESRIIEPKDSEYFIWEEVTNEFRGTVYSKVNDYTLSGEKIVSSYAPEQELTVYYTDTDETTNTLFSSEYLSQKDKYSYFLNNIHPLIEITNQTADTESELVLIKDSYANCMVPFLTAHFKKIYVFDTRYYKQSVSEFINSHEKVSEVLVLYNLGTMDSDLGIGGIY